MEMKPTIYLVDAFTDQPFAGNPAAVCLLPAEGDCQWMLQVAREMNLSETAFLHPVGGEFQLRWFAPIIEVDLCGHATLASAHVLWETGRLPVDSPARFRTRSGTLTCRRKESEIEMNFPAKLAEPVARDNRLNQALGVTPRFIGRSTMDYLIEVDSPETVRSIKPDFARLSELPVRGVIVTSRSDLPGFDFVSRFFAPSSGVNEDPVTGSAHCTLGPFWQARLNRSELVGRQLSSRGGSVKVRMEGDRVFLSGQAVTITRGELLPLPPGNR